MEPGFSCASGTQLTRSEGGELDLALAWLARGLRRNPERRAIGIAISLSLRQHRWPLLEGWEHNWSQQDPLMAMSRVVQTDFSGHSNCGDHVLLRDLRAVELEGRYSQSATILSASRSPDGSLIAAVQTDHRTQLWDVERMRPIGVSLPNDLSSKPADSDRAGLPHAVFSADGADLILFSGTGFARAYPLLAPLDGEAEILAKTAELMAGCRVTEEERVEPNGHVATCFRMLVDRHRRANPGPRSGFMAVLRHLLRPSRSVSTSIH